MIAQTPSPPYFAVIFTSLLQAPSKEYSLMAEHMVTLAAQQPGYLGHESAREAIGITVSYWESLEAIHAWKSNAEHQIAQTLGKTEWYTHYRVRICKVERDYQLEE